MAKISRVMSSKAQAGKRVRASSIGESTATSSSVAPTPPPHKHIRMPSSLSTSTDSGSTTSTSLSGSVIWNKSDSQHRPLYYPSSSLASSTSASSTFSSNASSLIAPSDFDSSNASSVPLDFSFLDSPGHSWSPSSSEFQTTSSVTLNNSTASKRPRYLDIENPSRVTSRASHRRSRTLDPAPTSNPLTSSSLQATTTTPPIPGYGPIRLTVTMDLPPPPQNSYFGTYSTTPVGTPLSEVPPLFSGTPSSREVETALDFLSNAEIRQLLRLAIQKHPSFATEVHQEYTVKSQAERSKTVNFVHYSNNVWHTLNTKYDKLDSDKQAEMAKTVAEDVAADIQAIIAQVKKESSMATKKSALETLRKIGRSICLTPGVVGEKVRKGLGYDARFVDAVLDVVGKFAPEDRQEFGKEKSGRELIKRLEQLDELRRHNNIFERFEEVLALLKGKEENKP